MGQVSGGGKGIASTSGTNLDVDNFGDFIVTGEGGNTGQVEVASSASLANTTLDSGSGLHVNSDTGQIALNTSDGGTQHFLISFSAGALTMIAPVLPTADPNVVGQVWNSAGVLHVSAG